ncbi:DUF5983 family protein [Actinoplanes aureus]|uniref:DUF5983 domain-containing protein n=1 Tax=Actinoplanes aureus TaxID=2792083 RepID=A0A931CPR3_9ACTN|nr:hypothetical protein [Actinoplanes aureus]MBG0568810.1 hypothetical protein [Actinoplanes aureus]
MSIRLEKVRMEQPTGAARTTGPFEVTRDVGGPEQTVTYSISVHDGGHSIRLVGTEPHLYAWLTRARTALSNSTDGPHIMNVVALSTHHLPEWISDDLSGFKGVTAYDTVYGWLLRVPNDLVEHRLHYPDTVPDEVWRLWEYAHKFSAEYILLDVDADPADVLPPGIGDANGYSDRTADATPRRLLRARLRSSSPGWDGCTAHPPCVAAVAGSRGGAKATARCLAADRAEGEQRPLLDQAQQAMTDTPFAEVRFIAVFAGCAIRNECSRPARGLRLMSVSFLRVDPFPDGAATAA